MANLQGGLSPSLRSCKIIRYTVVFRNPGSLLRQMIPKETKTMQFNFNWTKLCRVAISDVPAKTLTQKNKKLCYCRRTARRSMPKLPVTILSTIKTSCTTNPQQITVMELEGYSGSTCSKQPRLVDCRIGVVNKFDSPRRR